MPDSTSTSRVAGGDVVEGRQRLVFVDKGDYYELSPLGVFADGVVCWRYESTDFDGLRAAFDDGTLTLTPPEGASLIITGTAKGTVPALESWLTPELVIGELADEVDVLNDRPDSSRRCWDALLAYAADPTGAHLEAVRESYHAVPGHRRIHVLGDMDQNDVPVRILLAEVGETIPARRPGRTLTVTPEVRERALDYFRRSEAGIARAEAQRVADGPETTVPLVVGGYVYPSGWPDPAGLEVLQTDYPAAVTSGGREYASVMHAYWALSTGDAGWHDRIAAAARGLDARTLGEEAPRRAGWPTARLGVMAALLRDKFERHPAMAATLLGTGDARLLYNDRSSKYWSSGGANWLGRLLELVRSELATR
ncbi:NADAR family protein [Amycolatopsis sp. DG1A-15b]|uniref:NADAR family protein n=1 Tax=Amycolatopsis sp. DG1A-15b TaxID=3052846 RepID=UPI00255BF16D|nr:NADAR family protein [Amycolatopsis sp. DG1A-15b]WIX87822.1 NADAR family protein [Amycolatopsis sp. DG1A-15b]